MVESEISTFKCYCSSRSEFHRKFSLVLEITYADSHCHSVVSTSYALCSERRVLSAAWIQQYEHIGFWVAEFVELEDKNALRTGGKKREVKSDIQDIVVRIQTKVIKLRKEKRTTRRVKRIMEGKEKENKTIKPIQDNGIVGK